MERLAYIEQPFDFGPLNPFVPPAPVESRIDTRCEHPYEPDITNLFDQPTMQRLSAFHKEGIRYAIYSGAHVAAMLPDGERPIGDVDIVIYPGDYKKTIDTFGAGIAYSIVPLPLSDEKDRQAAFLMVGGMEIKASSDGMPGVFTLNDYVWAHCKTYKEKDSSPGGKPPFEATFVDPAETLLFKTALWRDKDQRDIQNLITTGVSFNINYLLERMRQTNVRPGVGERLVQLGILPVSSLSGTM